MMPARVFRLPGSALRWLAIAGLALLFATSPLSGRLETLWRDAAMRGLAHHWPVEGGHDLVIVSIDDTDLRAADVPLARLHRHLGDFLAAMQVAGPRAIGLDLILPEGGVAEDTRELERLLAEGMLRLRPGIPLVIGQTINEHGSPRPLPALIAYLAGPAGIGYVLLPRDDDGIIRRFSETLGSAGESVPTLVGQLLRALGQEPFPGLLQFGAPFGGTVIPLRQVLALERAGDISTLREYFAGRIVLLGATLPFTDLHASPLHLSSGERADGRSHGVFLHAQALQNLLDHNLLRPPSLVLTCLLAILASLACLLPPGRRTTPYLAGLVLAVLVSGVLTLRFGYVLPVATPLVVLAVAHGASGLAHWWRDRQERRRLRQTFERLVSPSVLAEILSGRIAPEPGGERRTVCILFADIVGFTTLSEQLAPEEVMQMLNRHYATLAGIVHAHGGMVDKFIGDGLMAVFGAPAALEQPCVNALAAAQAMACAMAQQAPADSPPFASGSGCIMGRPSSAISARASAMNTPPSATR